MENTIPSAELQHLRAFALESGDTDARFDSSGTRLVIPHKVSDGRMQHVYVYIRVDGPNDLTPESTKIVTFESTCHRFSDEELATKFKDIPLNLLQKNMHIHFGRFAMKQDEGIWSVLVSCDQLFETLDEDEFDSAVDYVAREADEYEKDIIGVDQY